MPILIVLMFLLGKTAVNLLIFALLFLAAGVAGCFA